MLAVTVFPGLGPEAGTKLCQRKQGESGLHKLLGGNVGGAKSATIVADLSETTVQTPDGEERLQHQYPHL